MAIGWIIEQIINMFGTIYQIMQRIPIAPYNNNNIPATNLLYFMLALLVANVALNLYFATKKK